MNNIIRRAMEEMHSRYTTILSQYYPAHNSIGFTERNLTNNFISALEKTLGKECISWFEAPICKDGSKHIDAVVFFDDVTILIEAKRFTSVNSQVESLKSDIERMHSANSIEALEDGLKIKSKKRKHYSIVLADVWTETKAKMSVYVYWPECISNNFFIYSSTLSFSDLPVNEQWKNNYKILIAVSEIQSLGTI